MARITLDQKRLIHEAIRGHLHLHGNANWTDVLSQFADVVSKATFFRMVKETVEKIEVELGAESPTVLRITQQRIRKAGDKSNTAAGRQAEIARNLPPVPAAPLPLPELERNPLPAPAVIAALGPKDGPAMLDVLANLVQCMEDAMLLRKTAIATDADGTVRVKNPMLFDRSITRRLAIGEDYMLYQERAFESDKQRELWRLVIGAIGEVSPDLQSIILARLRLLNSERGVSMAAVIS